MPYYGFLPPDSEWYSPSCFEVDRFDSVAVAVIKQNKPAVAMSMMTVMELLEAHPKNRERRVTGLSHGSLVCDI